MAASDPNQLKKGQEIGRQDVWFSVARLPDSSRLFCGSSDGKVYDVDLTAEKPEPVAMEGHSSYVTGAALADLHLVSGAWDGKLIWWDIENRSQVRAVDAHQRWIRGVEASPDGQYVASIGDDMVCRLWDAAGEPLRELRGHEAITPHHYPSMLYACAISPDGKYVATGDRVGRIVVWESATGEQAATLEAPVMYTWDPRQRRHSIGGIRSLAFSPDGKLLAAGGMGKVNNIDHLEGKARVEVFDWQQGERTHEFPGDQFKGLVERLQFAPEGNWLLAAGGDHGGFLMFFDMKEGSIMKQEKAPMHVHDFALNETAEKIYTVGHNKLVVWELAAEEAESTNISTN